MTGIPAGKVDVDWIRLITVTSNPALTRAAVMGVPKLPEAGRAVSDDYEAKDAEIFTPIMATFLMAVIMYLYSFTAPWCAGIGVTGFGYLRLAVRL